METLFQDVRYSARMLRKRPGFVLVAVLSLGLGIGANTAVFSVINTTALRPLPIERPEALVSLQNTGLLRTVTVFSYPNYEDYRDRNAAFDGLIGYRFVPLSVSHDGINEKMWGYLITGNYFDVLGVKPALGRLISPEDDRLPGGHPVMVISFKSWQQQFGADPSIVGREIVVSGRGFTVIGVAPKGFFGTDVIAAPDLWFPMSMQAQVEITNSWLDRRDAQYTIVQGLLKPGVSSAQANADLNSIARQLAVEHPEINEGRSVAIAPPGIGFPFVQRLLGFAQIVLAVVAFVLLLACVNLANLMLARAPERRKEIAVRMSQGGPRRRLVQQLLVESTLLSVGGGVFGLAIAFWLTRLANGFRMPVDFPFSFELHLDYRVLLFTSLISISTGILFGLLPALQTTRVDLLTALKSESRPEGYRRSSWKSALIVLQIALSLVLLIGAGLMLRMLQQTEAINLGFDPRNAIAVSFDLRLQGYASDTGRQLQQQLLERVNALPGVKSAGLVDLPAIDLHFGRSVAFAEGQSPERTAPQVMLNRTSPGYLAAMGTRLIAGRDFSNADRENAVRVAIVNETFARQFWPGNDAEEALGKRFRLGSFEAPPIQIVGVVEDGKYTMLSEKPQLYAALPLLQSYSGMSSLIVRTSSDPSKMVSVVRSEVARIDPRMPITSAPVAEKLSLALLPVRIGAVLFGAFGLLAAALTAIGIYGVMSYAVTSRTHEIGVRMALGASTVDILKLSMAQGLLLALAGVVSGLLAAFALTRYLQSLLFGVSPTDPLAFTIAGILSLSIAALASYLPARRASGISPMNAMR
jgi:predicted permease